MYQKLHIYFSWEPWKIFPGKDVGVQYFNISIFQYFVGVIVLGEGRRCGGIKLRRIIFKKNFGGYT